MATLGGLDYEEVEKLRKALAGNSITNMQAANAAAKLAHFQSQNNMQQYAMGGTFIGNAQNVAKYAAASVMRNKVASMTTKRYTDKNGVVHSRVSPGELLGSINGLLHQIHSMK